MSSTLCSGAAARVSDPKQAPDSCDTGRRHVLGVLITGYAASRMPGALAAPAPGGAYAAFKALSGILTGRSDLDTALGIRLYDALVADDAQFVAAVPTLVALINDRKVDVLRLQQLLDTERSPLAPLPRRIVRAWYLGIVGEGERARSIAYEHALNAVVVSTCGR